MPDINMQVFEEAQRNQLVTEVNIQTQVALNDYQVQLSDIANPTQSQDNIVIDRYGEFLPHWNESFDFDTWVKMSMEIAGKRVLVFSGNSNVNSVSNGSNTFNIFDDFIRADSSIVGNGWTEDINAGNGQAYIESNMLKMHTSDTGPDSSVRVIKDVSSLGMSQFIIETRMKITEITGFINTRSLFGTYDGDDSNAIWVGSGYINGSLTGFANYGFDGSYFDYGSAPSVGTWQKLKLSYDTTNEFVITIDESTKTALTGRPAYNDPFKLAFYGLSSEIAGGTLTTYYDWVFARKYTAVEPIATVGAEQNIAVALKSLGRAG